MNYDLVKSEQNNMLFLADQLIQQTHYRNLDLQPLKDVSREIEQIKPQDITCMFRIRELVCNKEKGTLDSLAIVLNALHSCGATCMMLLEYREGNTELYIGAVNKEKHENIYYLNTIREILRSGLEGNLPGIEMEELVTRKEIQNKLSECLDSGFDSQCITAVSCVAEQPKQIQSVLGMEKLLGAVGKKNFSILILADPINHNQLQVIRHGYENLSTQLSELESVVVSSQFSQNISMSKNVSESMTKSISESISHTQSHNVTNGWSAGNNTPDKNMGKRIITGAGALAVAAITENPMAGYMLMNVMGGPEGSENSSINESVNDGVSEGNTVTEQESRTVQQGSGISEGNTQGISMQVTNRNRHVKELLLKIESYLNWLNKCENFGMFNCCTYIISGNAGTNLLVGSQYQALLQGDGETNQPVTFNTWTKENGVENVRKSLSRLMHPIICRENTELSPAMLISSRELSRQMAFPQESVVGISVMEYAAFGREVVRKSPMKAGEVAHMGVITHMGKREENQPVFLDLQSLCSHTFIAGTNGSGKSNTIFCLLEELMRAKIPFMVIEPAKGEYKNVFMHDTEVKVNVYGTNKNKTPLLRLNPFWFNDDINVKEHISRIMDVFNASWPMYAAMPAVLNAAIENAYINCGWNLRTSKCSGKKIYPTVRDVLDALGKKMESTAFSDEVRGNYVGALSTRLETLSNGIFTDIFSGADLGDKELFESNVLIDLSRAGSPEVSAMIMGILLIRLQEYRMSEGAVNHPLRHVTVLEEAHHLLRKTSVAQSEDSSNMMGKAVEMISNAIAEMRSYGDGFIIADQSPGLLDMSVLRNTNTKIIMRLPEGGDREIIGNTIGLTPKQTYELSRLKTGICVIYQKDWLEPVLCQVNLAKHREELYVYEENKDEEERRHEKLIEYILGFQNEMEKKDVTDLIQKSALPGAVKRKLFHYLMEEELTWSRRTELAAEIEILTMELPFGDSEREYERWLFNTLEVNDLEQTECNRILIAACAWNLAKTQKEWRKTAEWLYKPENTDSQIADSRGEALTCILLPKEKTEITISEEKKKKIIEVLKSGEEQDKLLSEIFEQYCRIGESRKRGKLNPYCRIVWEYVGGDSVWRELYPFIEEQDYESWNRKIREVLAGNVICSEDVQNEILNLVLMNKGKQKEVRAFYYPWYAKTFHTKNSILESISEVMT